MSYQKIDRGPSEAEKIERYEDRLITYCLQALGIATALPHNTRIVGELHQVMDQISQTYPEAAKRNGLPT